MTALSYQALARIEHAREQGIARDHIEALTGVLSSLERTDWRVPRGAVAGWLEASAFWLVSAGLITPAEAGAWLDRHAQKKTPAGDDSGEGRQVMQKAQTNYMVQVNERRHYCTFSGHRVRLDGRGQGGAK